MPRTASHPFVALAARFRQWQQPPWHLATWAESPRSYRWALGMLLAVLASGATGLLTYEHLRLVPDPIDFVVVVLVTLWVRTTSARASEFEQWNPEGVICASLIFAGKPAEALACAIAGEVFGRLHRPIVRHLFVANLVIGASRIVLMATLFQAVAVASAPLSATWVTGVLVCFALNLSIDLTLYPPMLLSRATSLREVVPEWTQSVRSTLVGAAPLAMLVGAAIALPSRWYLLTLLIPQLIMGDVFRRSEQVVEAEAEKRHLHDSFARYVPESVVDGLMGSGHDITLGGEARDITVMFLDIRGFTAWSENRSPEDIVRQLNEVLSALTACVFESGGTLDKFTGDGLMAFWGAPLEQPDHAERAAHTARAMAAALAALNEARGEDERFHVGIGLHTGQAVVGNVGHDRRHDYTAIGDTVNLGSRIESATKMLDASVLISRDTFRALPMSEQAWFSHVRSVTVAGRAMPVNLFRLREEGALHVDELLGGVDIDPATADPTLPTDIARIESLRVAAEAFDEAEDELDQAA